MSLADRKLGWGKRQQKWDHGSQRCQPPVGRSTPTLRGAPQQQETFMDDLCNRGMPYWEENPFCILPECFLTELKLWASMISIKWEGTPSFGYKKAFSSLYMVKLGVRSGEGLLKGTYSFICLFEESQLGSLGKPPFPVPLVFPRGPFPLAKGHIQTSGNQSMWRRKKERRKEECKGHTASLKTRVAFQFLHSAPHTQCQQPM